MPKSRTHSGAKKRFRVTRTGKVLHKRMNKNHMLSKKSGSRKRRLSRTGELTDANATKAKRLLRGR
jgi:large subunit ribosomal protein L35